jgi:hypothetical protein
MKKLKNNKQQIMKPAGKCLQIIEGSQKEILSEKFS